MTLAITLVVVALVLCVVAGYLTWIAGRHERLSARADSAWAALDAQLIRRAAAAHALGLGRGDDVLVTAAEAALADVQEGREDVENVLGRILKRGSAGGDADADNVLADDVLDTDELREAAGRVHLARQFHNDAVRDLHSIRRRPAARLMRLGHGDHTGPGRVFFEIDDTVARPGLR